MARATPQVNIPYPSERQDPWYDTFVRMVNTVDNLIYSARVLSNVSVVKQSLIDYNPTTGVVTWASPILIRYGLTSAFGTIPAGTFTLQDGDVVYATLVVDPKQNYTVTLTKTSGVIPNSDSSMVIFRRQGSYLWVRDNGVLDGSTPNDLTGTVIKRRIPISLKETQGEGYIVMGIVRFNPSDYAMDDTLTQFNILVEAQVNPDALPGNVFLYETTTTPTLLETFSFVSDQSSQQSFALVPSNPLAELVYEVRGGLDPLSGPFLVNDALTLWHATVEITNTYL